ncbi:Alpha/Beta hydrolase protein [Microdochium trichocladiopsis]|uniref:Carboxylic ester hydrolase n=1 Tax=Microdochium trichocladiopsis TaxID=1682393 RepID=A0A9P8Y4J6_9PEZI|nr:Alpha/Beta hydrolase protein [Microdochium trichocladiopsis]KAH7028920.1 Alpha/Beta hydrolase protein [Microdochium trichocladiopsis]
MSNLKLDSTGGGSHEWAEHHHDAGELGHLTGLEALDTAGQPLVYYFGGIPYAQAPTGERRFRVPQRLPKDHKYGTREAPGRFVTGTRPCPQPASSNTPAASAMSEDCLQLNMWVPAGPAPAGGWPVCVWIHGGFLQVGSPNLGRDALVPLLADPRSAVRAIFVMPAYRLNALGFLGGSALAAEAAAAGEPCGNAGLWDQRAALEWTRDCIAAFGGDPANISVLGYSAGAYSVFQQLAHELYRHDDDVRPGGETAIIRRVAMLSNGPGVRPKSLDDQQRQFDELANLLGIPADLPAAAKLAELRRRPWEDLVAVQNGGDGAEKTMRESEFRAWADGDFYPLETLGAIASGDFAARMRARGITLLTGECEQEHTVYVRWRTPADSYAAVNQRLCADYGDEAGRRILEHYCCGDGDGGALPAGYKDWQDLFGRLYANVQVHHLSRGFLDGLFRGGLVAGRDVLRYRMERRVACVDERLLPEWGVTHLSDIPVWLWGADYAGGLTGEEKEMLAIWNQSLAEFVRGDAVVSGWEGTSGPLDVRRWRRDGGTDVWEDGELWDQGVAFWKSVNQQ